MVASTEGMCVVSWVLFRSTLAPSLPRIPTDGATWPPIVPTIGQSPARPLDQGSYCLALCLLIGHLVPVPPLTLILFHKEPWEV